MDNTVEHVIRLSDGGPWGFRLAGGADYRCPLEVSKVRVNSKAYLAGIEEGDIILKVNEIDVRLASHRDVMRLVEQGGDNIIITVLRQHNLCSVVIPIHLKQSQRYNSSLSSDWFKLDMDIGEGATYRSTCEWEWKPVRSRSCAPFAEEREPSDFTSTVCSYSTRTRRGVESAVNLYKTFVEKNSQGSVSRAGQQFAEASLVRSREPSISRAQVTLGRAPSPSRALHIITGAQSRRHSIATGRPDGLLKVDINTTSPAEYKSFQSEVPQRRQPPPKPARSTIGSEVPRAASLPRTVPHPIISQIVHPSSNIATGGERESIFASRSIGSQPVVVPIKPFAMPKNEPETVEFKVRAVKAPKQFWQPAKEGEASQNQDKEPAKDYWELMKNQPDHLPGMVDPLIVDDTQGDFGGNPIIHPERDLYSDSSFYTTKDRMYPTIPEQMRLCKMISSILEAPGAMRSRGGKMYHQRKNCAEKWAKESMGQKYEPPYSGLDSVYTRPYTDVPHWPSRMKENLSVDELERLEHNTENISKHDLLPPVVAFDINSALTRSRNHGKGVDLYRKNAERAEEFTIDENNRQQLSHFNRLDDQLQQNVVRKTEYKSPWKAAWEGNIERAFAPDDPCAVQSVHDEPDLRQDRSSHALGYDHQQATFGVKYKGYAPVRAPRGPGVLGRQLSSSTSALNMVGRGPARLHSMIGAREEERPTFDTYTHKWCLPSYYNERRQFPDLLSPAGYTQQSQDGMKRYSSVTELTLRRPKEYIAPHPIKQPQIVRPQMSERLADLDPPPFLRRPRDYHRQSYDNHSPYSMPCSPHITYEEGNNQSGISIF